MQTILASKVFVPTPVPTFSERIELSDGDFIDINLSKKNTGDIVAIFHGLTGCVSSSYITGAIGTLEAAGFRAALMHWRGCSGEPNRVARSYHSGASDDIDWFIHFLQRRFCEQRIYALGYSLGANALLKYLGESGSDCLLAGAVAVSPPLMLEECANKMNRGVSRVYQRHLLAQMRSQHENKRLAYPGLNLRPATQALDSFWKFDEYITAPLHQYDGAHDYYARCSARQFLPHVHVPTHILCAGDDPFFTKAILPNADELGPHTTLEVSHKGGHVGFLSDRSDNRRWLDSRVAHVLKHYRAASGCQ